VKVVKIASETSVILTLAYGEYNIKKIKYFDRYRSFKEEHEDVQDDKWAAKNAKDRIKCKYSTNRRALR
jgi:hypothetical protein